MNHSSLKGDVAVLLAAARFAEAGLVILKPICEALPFDVAIFQNGHFFRVQVKRAMKRGTSGRWIIPFRKISPNSSGYTKYRYDTTHADFLCGVVVETGDIYCFPLSGNPIQSMAIVDPNGIGKKALQGHGKVDSEKFRNKITLQNETFSL